MTVVLNIRKPTEVLTDFLATLPDKSDSDKWLAKVIDFAIIYGDVFGPQLFDLLREAEALAAERGNRVMEILSILNRRFLKTMAKGVHGVDDTEETLAGLHAIVGELQGNEWYPLALNMTGYEYWFRGEYDKGFEIVFDALRVTAETDTVMKGWQHFALGVFYFDTSDLDASYSYCERASRYFESGSYTYGRARALNGMASVLIKRNDVDAALPLLEEVGTIYTSLSHYTGLSRTLNDQGLIARMQGRYTDALAFFDASIRLRGEIDHYQGLITSQTEKAQTFMEIKKYPEALAALGQALEHCRSTSALQKESRIHKLYYDIYKAQGDTESALTHFEDFFRLRTSIMSDDATNRIRRLQSNFEKESAEKQAEIERLRNVELKKAYAIITEKNKDIQDSIAYAKRIQQAILPPEQDMIAAFSDGFVLYLPKDVVAGDFYFFEETDTHTFIAAADCTGHGVPGALVSVACANALSRSVNEYGLTEPGEILGKCRELVKHTFGKSGSEIKDGMDISLLIRDGSGNYSWSGANNSLWILHKSQMHTIVADKQCVGYSHNEKPFTSHRLDVHRGDWLYLITDGFADQFGGPKGKKFKYSQLEKEIASGGSLPGAKQHALLLDAFNSWKGELEQVDDVCVIGVRV